MSSDADRRQYRRFNIDLEGQIDGPNGDSTGCTVRDFCEGGLLVQLSGEHADGFTAGQQIQLSTRISTADGERPLRLKTTVAWSSDQYLGVSFSRPSSAIIGVLRQHQRLQDSVADRKPTGATRGQMRVLARLRHVAKGLLPELLRDLLIDVSEGLLNKADTGVLDVEQQQLYVDINAIESLRKGEGLLRAVLDFSDEGTPGVPLATGAQDEGLSLVDQKEFERWLEASRAATLLDRKFNEQLSALGSRLDGLRDNTGATALGVPCEPQHFTAALKDIARRLELGTTTRTILFDCAVQRLGQDLGKVYQQMDATLSAAGAPAARERRLHVVRADGSGGVHAARSGGAEAGKLAGDHADAPDDAASAAPAVMSVPLQVNIDPAALQQLRELEQQQRADLAQDMLAHVGDRPDTTESLQQWLDALEGPLQREAMEDATFFRNRKHPLREIVDLLGHLQMFRPTPDAATESDETRERVSSLLQPLIDGGSDAATIQSIAQDLGGLTAEQSRRYQQNVERVVEASEGRDRVRRARLRVIGDLNERYAGRSVPQVMPQLLDAGWRSVLELALINAASQEEQYAQRLRLIDVLVARLGGEAFEAVADDLTADKLLVGISAELTTVAFDPFRVTAAQERIKEALLNPPRGASPLITFVALEDEHAEQDQHPPQGIPAPVWQQLIDSCERIRVGDRLRFTHDPGAPQELRVAWIRDDRALLVLVDHRGFRVRDISRHELAIGMNRREIQVEHADGQPLSDRAVDVLLNRMEERLRHQVAHDSLTGLMNRQQFQAALEQAIRQPNRQAGEGVLLWIDIDQFRLVNDMHGYDTGDRLLVTVARQLEHLAGSSLLAHIGADRFAMLVPGLSSEAATAQAQSVCDSIMNMPFEWSGHALGLSASVGLVALDAGDGAVSSVLQAADDALSAAKGSGGNCVLAYSQDDPDIQRHRESVRWVAQVDDALEHGQLKLRCQPIVPIRPGEGLDPHYEVLLGVASGSQEALPIAEFIDAAERYKRMQSVDRWVTRTVMEWIAAHRVHMPALHGFAVNLSGQTASDPGFVEYVRQQFQRTGIDPSWLSFEVTETAAVADLSSSAGIVRDLKAMGCKVALDDFGSGLASYSYLKELPVDWLKIDGVFVRKIAADREDFAVVKSINEIGHFLGKHTIAEYVTDAEVLRLVAGIGVDYAQGYGVSAPFPMDKLLQHLHTTEAQQA